MRKTLVIVFVIVVSIAISVLFLISNKDGIDHYIQSDYAKAYDLFLNDSVQNSDDEFRLAMLYMEGKGTPKNLAKAENALLSAANKKNPEALYNLGVYKFTGVFSFTDEEQRGLKYVKESADLGLGEAQVLYAKLLVDDKTETLEPNEPLSQEYAKKAKENGFIDGQLIYGMALFMEDKIDEATKELEPIYSSNYQFPALALREIYSDNPEKLEQYDVDGWEAFGLVFELAFRLEPRPLSIYGSFNKQTTPILLKKLEAAAELNSKEAITFLAQLYSDGFVVDQDKQKALAYLHPLIEARDPEVLYLAHLIDTDNSQYLIDSAEQNYLPAIYRLSQVYMNEVFIADLGYDTHLGKEYKEKAASLGSKEAILDILEAINLYSQQNAYTYSSSDVYEHDQYAKYALQLLSIEPNSAIGNYHFGYAYKVGLGVKEDSSKAFQYINRAYTLQPENQIFAFQLADMYLQAIGTEANPEKAVEVYQTLAKDRALSEYTRHYAQIELVKNYYAYDLQEYISQKHIKDYLVSFFDEDNSYGAEDIMYRLGDIYLAEGNYEKAVEIYKQYLDESDVAKIAYGKALLQHNEEENRVEAIRILKEVMNSDERIGRKNWDELNDLLFEYALDDAEVQIYIANMAAILGTEKFIQYIDESFETNLDVAYAYVSRKIKIVKSDDGALKNLYEKLLKIADKEYAPAFNLIDNEINYSNLKTIMQLTDERIVMLYQKGAELGSDQMKYELGKFYRSGKYVQRDWKKALEYFQSQEDQTIGLTSSNIKDLQEAINELDRIQTSVKNNEADGFYDLSEVYRRGRFGEDENQELAEKYLQKAIDLGSIKYKESVISELSYTRNKDKRLQNINQYNQYMIDVATSGYARWQEELGERYLYGENIQADREKARYWLEKAYENDKKSFAYALRSMNVFEYNMELAQKNNNAEAMYEVGFSYDRGIGVNKDVFKAIEWFEKSYQETKNEKAAFQLGHIYYRGAFDEHSEMIMEPDWDKAVFYYSTVPVKFQDYAQSKIDFYNDSIVPSREGDVAAILRVEQFYKTEQRESNRYNKLREQLLLKAIDLGSEEAEIRYKNKEFE